LRRCPTCGPFQNGGNGSHKPGKTPTVQEWTKWWGSIKMVILPPRDFSFLPLVKIQMPRRAQSQPRQSARLINTLFLLHFLLLRIGDDRDLPHKVERQFL
jgi:hypothetical protein